MTVQRALQCRPLRTRFGRSLAAYPGGIRYSAPVLFPELPVKTLAALFVSLLLAGCHHWPAASVLKGEAFYLQRIALPPTAVLSVTLADVSLADAPARPLARYTGAAGAQVPIAFELSYDRGLVAPGHRYALTARIEAAGELLWINTQAYPVALDGSDAQPLRIKLDPVR